ncbi:ribonuclease P protein component [uncultured Pseudokineococcus sp.]|uniref:ribonuclease P protein component n=1 Tax=uncultured Pseudokineococcus sp. TaxID=1642928 RepID=UPI00262E598B|nr:ribonuclease P protein component [uncultured Pseudokineococcus sp.]
MLPAGRRVRTADAFGRAVRGGARAGRPTLVVHVLIPSGAAADDATPSPRPAAAGFVVSRAVGGAVVRNRVRRRLRHLVADRLEGLPAGTELVVRALPPSAGATSADLALDLDDALRRARRGGRSGAGRPGGPRSGGSRSGAGRSAPRPAGVGA